MNEPPDKYQDYYKCVKVPLKHVVKHYDINQPISIFTNIIIKKKSLKIKLIK